MMKYTIGVLILVLWFNLFAENQFGDIMLGGKIDYSTHEYDYEFTSNGFPRYMNRETGKLYVHPYFGYFVSKSIALGLGLKYEYIFTKHINVSSNSTTEGYKSIFSYAPFFTKYFKINDKLYFSTMLEIEVGFGEDEFEYNDKIKTEIFRLGGSLSPTISYSLSKNWLMTISCGSIYYYRTRETLVGEGDYQNINNRLGIKLNLEKIYLGLQYIYRAKKQVI